MLISSEGLLVKCSVIDVVEVEHEAGVRKDAQEIIARATVSKCVATMMFHFIKTTDKPALRNKLQQEVKKLRAAGFAEKSALPDLLYENVLKALSLRY
eukprot:1607525-Amphidinium_carterae.2